MRDEMLCKIEFTVITDDSTGCYRAGELDFGCSGYYKEWARSSPENREILAKWCEEMARMIRDKKGPFYEVLDPSLGLKL